MYKKIFFLLFLNFTIVGFSQTKLPSFFSNHMVLQQNERVAIWGFDSPNVLVNVEGSWGKKETVKTDKIGKWKLNIQTPKAGGPYSVVIKGSEKIELHDVMIGEVWICSGQSNMEMPVKGFKNQPINNSNETILNSKNNNIRIFNTSRKASLTPMNEVEGNWKISNPTFTGDFSATAYFFGKKLEGILQVPVGLIITSWGASSAEAWTDKETLEGFKTITIPTEIYKRAQITPSGLFNAMLNPFIGFTIKGSIWYQGEGNRNRANEYTSLMNAMITSWREKWGQGNFPFYFVQIAPFGYKDVNSAFLREAQLGTMQSIKNTGMVVTMDIGDCDYIHPREKKLVGDRLAYWALAKDYGMEGIGYTAPIYNKMNLTGKGEIELFFDDAPIGITSFGEEVTEFEIAGEDQIFYPAEVKIIRREALIIVKSDKVEAPVAVRYAFKNCVKGSLFGTNGLPVSSFRTDNWKE